MYVYNINQATWTNKVAIRLQATYIFKHKCRGKAISANPLITCKKGKDFIITKPFS